MTRLTRGANGGMLSLTLGRVQRKSLQFWATDTRTSASAPAKACALSPETQPAGAEFVLAPAKQWPGGAQTPRAMAGHPQEVASMRQHTTPRVPVHPIVTAAPLPAWTRCVLVSTPAGARAWV